MKEMTMSVVPKRPPGRPPIGPPMRRYTIMLTDAQAATAREIGNSNMSVGVRSLLDGAEKNPPRTSGGLAPVG